MLPPVSLPVDERILEAADECFVQFGIDKTTMDDVATRAGISRATVYRYFDGRDSIIAAALRRRGSRLYATQRERLEQWPSFAERLEEGIVGDVQRGKSDSIVQLLASDPRRVLTAAGNANLAAEVTLEFWEPIFRTAQETGELGADTDLRELAAWLSHLEVMFITQFGDDDDAIEKIRNYVRRYVVPAVVSG